MLTESVGEHTEAGLNYWGQKLKWPQTVSLYSRLTHRFIVPTFLPELFKVDTQANRPHCTTQELQVAARKAGVAKACLGVVLLITDCLKGMCAWIWTHQRGCITSNKSFTPFYLAAVHSFTVSVVVGHLPCVKWLPTSQEDTEANDSTNQLSQASQINYMKFKLTYKFNDPRDTWIEIQSRFQTRDATHCCILAH